VLFEFRKSPGGIRFVRPGEHFRDGEGLASETFDLPEEVGCAVLADPRLRIAAAEAFLVGYRSHTRVDDYGILNPYVHKFMLLGNALKGAEVAAEKAAKKDDVKQ
jgi:hypothetical protein